MRRFRSNARPGRLPAINGTAPAKINLALHVGSRRQDGLHRLASLVAFCELADDIRVEAGEGLDIQVDGPQASGAPNGAANLAHPAAKLVLSDQGARIRINKRIPTAAGLGGGSADAAATIRLISSRWNLPMPSPVSLMELGADVPACVAGVPALVTGAGECVEPVDHVPRLPIVIANPRIPVLTRSVFRAHSGTGRPMLSLPAPGCSIAEFIAWLSEQRNDLQSAAIELAPGVAEVLGRLVRLDGCLLARMSGSGSSCFGIFGEMAEARHAAVELQNGNPGWWVAATACLPSGSAVRPSW